MRLEDEAVKLRQACAQLGGFRPVIGDHVLVAEFDARLDDGADHPREGFAGAGMLERLAMNANSFDGCFGCGDFERIQFLQRTAWNRHFGAYDVDRGDAVSSADRIFGGSGQSCRA
ncbi:hypothetical protein FQZ97_1018910 [compost metagenome]